MPRLELPPGRRSPATRITLLAILLFLLFGIRSLASYAIEIEWWKELGQLNTWFSMLYYSIAPVAAATLLAFAALWISHARALKFAGTGLSEHPIYARISTLALLFLAWFIAAGAIDTWTVVRFAGSRGLPANGDRLARRNLQSAAFVLSFRPSVLFAAAQLLAGGNYLLRAALLGGGARVATALQDAATARRARTGPLLFQAGGRTGIAIPARGGGDGIAGAGGALLPGTLRDGVQRAWQLPGGNRLRGLRISGCRCSGW